MIDFLSPHSPPPPLLQLVRQQSENMYHIVQKHIISDSLDGVCVLVWYWFTVFHIYSLPPPVLVEVMHSNMESSRHSSEYTLRFMVSHWSRNSVFVCVWNMLLYDDIACILGVYSMGNNCLPVTNHPHQQRLPLIDFSGVWTQCSILCCESRACIPSPIWVVTWSELLPLILIGWCKLW